MTSDIPSKRQRLIVATLVCLAAVAMTLLVESYPIFYRPPAQESPAARLDDLRGSVVPILRQLPGVARVDVSVAAREPTHRIIHLRDWHYIPRILYAIDLRDMAGKPLSDAEVDRLHEQLCQQVEAVQQEQMVLLRVLIKDQGLKSIYCEGLTQKELPGYRERLVSMRSLEKEEIPQLEKQLAEVRGLKKSAQRTAIEKELTALLQQHRENLLEVGAAGRLYIAGEIEILPLDDAELLEQAKPITPGGKIKFDAAKVAAREDAIVKLATAGEPLAVIVLGASHDLSASVRRVRDDRCEYIQVTTKLVDHYAGGKEFTLHR